LPPAEGPGPGPGGPAPGGAAQAECLKQASPLRDETQKRASLLQAASKRHAAAPEACKLLQSFSQAEVRLLNFVTTKQSACGIPAEVPKQMKEAHAHTEQLAKQICAAANAPQQGAGPGLSDVLGTPSFAPEDIPTKRKGGSTFDTLKGNVLESH
jgi:hypothetical protein